MLKIGLYINQKVTAGGGFQEAISSLDTIDQSNQIKIIIFTSLKENLRTINALGYEAIYIPLNPLRRFQLFIRYSILRTCYKVIPGNISISRLLKKIIGKHNYFEKHFVKSSIDLIYFTSPDPSAFYIENLNFISTLWDLAHRTIPEFPELRENESFETRDHYYSKVLPRSFACIVGHSYAKQLAVKIYNISPERVFILPFKPSKFLIDIDKKQTMTKFNTDKFIEKYPQKSYIFYPAQLWPHKNHVYIIDALKILKINHNVDIKLFCTGSDKGNYKYLLQLIKKEKMSKFVKFLGFVEPEELYLLYKNSLAVVMPTYIGPASLPTLEAFKLGVPVIYSNLQHFVDSYQDGCLYMDLQDPSTLAKHILNLLADNNLRTELIQKGHSQLKKIQAQTQKDDFIKHILSYHSIKRTFN